MKIYKIAQEIQEPIAPVQPSPNPLNGKSNEQARKILRNLVDAPSKGLFNDQYWRGPNGIFSVLSKANIEYSIESTSYGVSPNFQQSWTGDKWKIPNDYKEWIFIVAFINNKSKQTTLNCRIVAMGAGTVSDPLEKYDMAVMIG